MKQYVFIPVILILLAFLNGCDKEENKQPSIAYNAGSYTYRLDESTFFKLGNDSLFKYTSAGKVYVPHTIDSITGNLSSTELNVNNMLLDSLFPAQGNTLVCVSGDPVIFTFDGTADGVVMYYGDSTASGTSHIYSDYPFAKGVAVNMNPDEEFGMASYTYREPGMYSATMVARNYWRIDEAAKEQDEVIEVVVLDLAVYTFLE